MRTPKRCLKYDSTRNFHYQIKVQPRSQGPLSTSRKYPGYGLSRGYACQPKRHRGWVLDLILSLLSREVNVSLLHGRYFEREASSLLEILLASASMSMRC